MIIDPEDIRPHKDEPFYHLLAENSKSDFVACVSEQNLLPDKSTADPAFASRRNFHERQMRRLSPAQSVAELDVFPRSHLFRFNPGSGSSANKRGAGSGAFFLRTSACALFFAAGFPEQRRRPPRWLRLLSCLLARFCSLPYNFFWVCSNAFGSVRRSIIRPSRNPRAAAARSAARRWSGSPAARSFCPFLVFAISSRISS